MLIGGVMSISNLYVGLKTGWGLGVTVTSCIIAYAVFSALERIVPAWRNRHFTILENYTMSSAASAAGYMSSAGLVSAIPALYLTTGRLLEWWEIGLWLAALSMLGVFMAIPLKRQLINIDQLPFPSGIATAETLRSLHTAGGAAVAKARALFLAAGAGGVLAIWRDLPAPSGDDAADGPAGGPVRRRRRPARFGLGHRADKPLELIVHPLAAAGRACRRSRDCVPPVAARTGRVCGRWRRTAPRGGFRPRAR